MAWISEQFINNRLHNAVSLDQKSIFAGGAVDLALERSATRPIYPLLARPTRICGLRGDGA